MDFIYRVFVTAFYPSLDTAQAIIFLLIIGFGLVTYFVPGMKMPVNPTAWQTALVVLGSIVLIRLLLAPYSMWNEEHTARLTAEKSAAELTQQLNKKRDRAAIKGQLRQFYADSARLLADRKITNEEDVQKYGAEITAWKEQTFAWIEQNIGSGAAARFADFTPYLNAPYFTYGGSFNGTHNWLMNYAGFLRRNLMVLIETDAWDKPQ